MMQKLHETATAAQSKEFVTFTNGTHNETWREDGYYDQIGRWLNSIIKTE